MPVMLSTAEDVCPHSAVCQASPNNGMETTPNANSDLDSDDATSINSAWAGIAVVIVVVIVGFGVWFGVRRRRRARGGHNSVEVGGSRFQLLFGREFGAFWRKSSAAKSSEQPIAVGGDLELVEGEEAKQRRSSSATNLKRTTTSGTVETDATHVAKLDTQSEGAGVEARVHPIASQSVVMMTSAPSQPPTYDASQTPRPSTPSSIRSSLSRLSIPPPGLGAPIHAPAEPLLLSTPSSDHP